MSEIVGKSIVDLERRISKFGKQDKTEEEIAEFKKQIKKEFKENIKSDLIGLLKELQEQLPSELAGRQQRLLRFSGYGSKFTLTKYGVEDVRHPYNFECIEYLVDCFLYPNLKEYPKEHNPSIGGAKFLWKRIDEIGHNGFKLEGKY